jgi:hypothetical protein
MAELIFGFIYFGYLALLSIGTSVIIWEKL